MILNWGNGSKKKKKDMDLRWNIHDLWKKRKGI